MKNLQPPSYAGTGIDREGTRLGKFVYAWLKAALTIMEPVTPKRVSNRIHGSGVRIRSHMHGTADLNIQPDTVAYPPATAIRHHHTDLLQLQVQEPSNLLTKPLCFSVNPQTNWIRQMPFISKLRFGATV